MEEERRVTSKMTTKAVTLSEDREAEMKMIDMKKEADSTEKGIVREITEIGMLKMKEEISMEEAEEGKKVTEKDREVEVAKDTEIAQGSIEEKEEVAEKVRELEAEREIENTLGPTEEKDQCPEKVIDQFRKEAREEDLRFKI